MAHRRRAGTKGHGRRPRDAARYRRPGPHLRDPRPGDRTGGTNTDLLYRLGPHTTGKGCLYLKRLDDVDREVLAELIERAWADNHQPAD